MNRETALRIEVESPQPWSFGRGLATKSLAEGNAQTGKAISQM
jgi:hypothetical protein